MEAIPRIQFALDLNKPLHIRDVRLAVFGWALARSLDGDFVLALENSAETSHPTLDALREVGVDWDEAVDANDFSEQITHIVGKTPSASALVAIYNANDWPQPAVVELPPLLDPQGEALPKRGYLLRDFQQQGFLPQAIWNALLLLSWRPKDGQEIFTKWTVRQQFQLADVSPEAVRFDWDKLRELNQYHLSRLSNDALAEQLRDFLEDAYGALPNSPQWLIDLTRSVRGELVVLEDVIDSAEWAFEMPAISAEARQLLQAAPTKTVLTHLVAELATVVLIDEATATSMIKGLQQRLAKTYDWDLAQVREPIAAALIGTITSGATVESVLAVLGKQRSMERLAAIIR